MQVRFFVVLSLLGSASIAAADGNWRKQLVDQYGPAGIMNDHVQAKGQWRVEYRYMNTYLDDNLIGNDQVSDAVALGTNVPVGPPGPGITIDGITTNVGATPTQMTRERHMLQFLYGASDDVTLYTMAMLPSLTMDHLRSDFTDFRTHNSGFGDTAFGALLNLWSDEDESWIFNLGCSVPTGDIDRESSLLTGTPTPLSYPLRLGSGTFNFRPGLTYRHFADWWSWGAQFQTDLPIGRNDRGYSVGEEYRLNTWTSVLLTDQVALSLRSQHLWQASYDGFDPTLSDALVSTHVESFRGGYWYSLGFGAQANLRGHHLSTEIVPTIRQDLNGIQLETDFSVIASWSKTF